MPRNPSSNLGGSYESTRKIPRKCMTIMGGNAEPACVAAGVPACRPKRHRQDGAASNHPCFANSVFVRHEPAGRDARRHAIRRIRPLLQLPNLDIPKPAVLL